MSIDRETRNRYWQLPPDFRFRIETILAYNPDFDPEYDIWISEQALLIANTLREESLIYFFPTYDRARQFELVPDLGPVHTKESIDQAAGLALQYVRNPSSVGKVGILKDERKKKRKKRDGAKR